MYSSYMDRVMGATESASISGFYLNMTRGMGLLQFRQAVDDAESYVFTELDLDHLAGEALANLLDLLNAEPQLPSAPFDQVVEQQGGEVMDLFVVGMLAEIEDLRHGGCDKISLRGLLIAELQTVRQCPKGRGPVRTTRYALVYHKISYIGITMAYR